MRVNIQEQLHGLQTIAAGLCADASIQVMLGEQWCFSPSDRVLYVDAKYLEKNSIEACAGIIAHEVGHALITRYHAFQSTFAPARLWHFFMNALEDRRVERFMIKRYPGVAPWLRAAYQNSQERKIDHPLRTIRFSHGMVRELEYLFPDEERACMDPRIEHALEVTRSERRRYADAFLPEEWVCSLPTSLDDFEASTGASRLLISERESLIRDKAKNAFDFAVQALMPYMKQFHDEDCFAVAQIMTEDTAMAEFAVECLANLCVSEFVDRLRRPIVQVNEGTKPSAPNLQLARRLLDAYFSSLSEKGEALSPIPSAMDSPFAFRKSRLRGVEGLQGTEPRREGKRLQLLQDATFASKQRLIEQLETVIPKRRRTVLRQGYSTGSRLHLPTVIAAQTDARELLHVWSRTRMPHRRDISFLLLVDLSGSMRGQKIEAAEQATFMLAEALDALRIPFAIYGFQDELIRFVDFGSYAQQRAKLAEMRDEVEGVRVRGNNSPSFNDDGPCLLEAATILAAQPTRDRVLLVMSDGHPEGRRSSASDLVESIEQIENGTLPIELFGLGIGPGTDHVTEYYRRGIANVELQALSFTLARWIKQRLQGGSMDFFAFLHPSQ